MNTRFKGFADSKLHYMMLFAKHNEVGLCGSPKKSDRNYLGSKLSMSTIF